jgi:hypothetical protein
VRHALLTDLIREVHLASRGTYGYRRVHAELTLGRGLVIAHGTVELLMARAGLAGVTGRPRWKGTRPDLIAKDLGDRQFNREGPTSCGSPTSPSTTPAKASSTARSCSTPTPAVWSAGRSTPRRPRHW